jgi:hypothetical protein
VSKIETPAMLPKIVANKADFMWVNAATSSRHRSRRLLVSSFVPGKFSNAIGDGFVRFNHLADCIANANQSIA